MLLAARHLGGWACGGKHGIEGGHGELVSYLGMGGAV